MKEYVLKKNYGEVVGVYKVFGETKKYYKIKEGNGFTYVDKETGRIRGASLWCTTSYVFVSYDEAKEEVDRIKCINVLCDFHYDDWKKVSTDVLSKIVILLKEDGLCEVQK